MDKNKSLANVLNANSVAGVSIEDIYVESIKVFKANQIVRVHLIGDAPNDDFIMELIKEFQSKFGSMKFEINIDSCDKIKVPSIDEIKTDLLKVFPSSIAWIDSCNIEVEETGSSIFIFVPNDISYRLIMSSAELINRLNQDFSPFKFSFKLAETESEDCNCPKEEFIEEILKEEVEFAKKNAISCSNQKPKASTSTKNDGNGKKDWAKIRKAKKEYISMPINKLTTEIQYVTVVGEVFKVDKKEFTRKSYDGKSNGIGVICSFGITDYDGSGIAKMFYNKEDEADIDEIIKVGNTLKINGEMTFDRFSKIDTLQVKKISDVEVVEKEIKQDNALEKRVELHLHTKMSSMDGINNIDEYVKRASKWGHKAIGITDHGVVQGFPEAMDAAKKYGVKMLYGVEGYIIDDTKGIASNFVDDIEYSSFVVFDVETTGFSPINDRITEIGAVRIENGKIVDRYNELINPEKEIPLKVVQLTGISQALVANCPTIDQLLPGFAEFIKDSVLVAHNASFDMGFMRENFRRNGLELNNPVIDTLEFSRSLFTQFKNHKLGTIAKNLGVSLENAHRAVHDAEATAEIFLKMLDQSIEKYEFSLNELNSSLNRDSIKGESFHIIIYAKNYVGLKNLYKLISASHLKYFYKKPRIPKSLINKYREGLLIGTACEAGELYKAITGAKSPREIDKIVEYYDYLEIQPLGNNMFLTKNGMVNGEKGLQNINRRIYELGKKHNKLVVATGDVHFLEPKDEVYRKILMFGQGFRDAEDQPPLFFRTTQEMLDEFSYLGDSVAREVVIENTNKIADMFEEIIPIPNETFPPEIANSEKDLKEMTFAKAHELYGEVLPEIVENRLNTELNSIIKHGYSVLYIISQKLVKKSNDDGYIVGSRGSVGSSFVATMSGITEVNPLPPHYRCPKCSYSEFVDKIEMNVFSGVDLPDKICPDCGEMLAKDGHDIPFEVFLGFDGDKEPDIDLNFAGEYQSKAHKYVEELFGEGYVFRAGTIGTIANKTAYGFVKKYFEETEQFATPLEIDRLAKGCEGIKRTSGQHPGGIMICPKHKDIHDFTPIQYPADDRESGVITTHFDYRSISGRILKLDILGHDGPSMIKMLETFTDTDSSIIPLNEETTMSIFSGVDALNINQDIMKLDIGTLGIPEFGTGFVRQMLLETKPSSFAELVRISGLSHGTDVWISNAQDLVKSGEATLKDIISTREDIMNDLISAGAENKTAFTIMEAVRKGKGLTDEQEKLMSTLDLPPWYAESCKKIQYMFPKAHAAAYVMLSFRIAYYKVFHPLAFYATYFTTKILDFDGQTILSGMNNLKLKMDEMYAINREWNYFTPKEKAIYTIWEVALEMYSRGYEFTDIDLYNSDAKMFKIVDNKILPPLRALTGLGESVANNIVEERENGPFISIEDFAKRTKASKTVVELLKENECFFDLPDTNQLSFFGFD
ncbi:MAG: PolC-type DNA polymerase III [Tissierellia bacterium]|nr:PolC-type DNA polymerase III [Tissierellia bacterium]